MQTGSYIVNFYGTLNCSGPRISDFFTFRVLIMFVGHKRYSKEAPPLLRLCSRLIYQLRVLPHLYFIYTLHRLPVKLFHYAPNYETMRRTILRPELRVKVSKETVVLRRWG